jgi:hypothetical protein
MEKGVNPFNPILSKIERFDQAERQVQLWESARVEWTLRRLKLEPQRKEVLRCSPDKSYSFANFHAVICNFPIRLFAEFSPGVVPLHRNSRAIHPLWFKSFRQLPFVDLYLRRYDELPEEKKITPVGMIFRRKGFAQGLILHNGDWETFLPESSSCHIFRGGKRQMNLMVQPYIGFLDHVREGLGWQPQG